MLGNQTLATTKCRHSSPESLLASQTSPLNQVHRSFAAQTKVLSHHSFVAQTKVLSHQSFAAQNKVFYFTGLQLRLKCLVIKVLQLKIKFFYFTVLQLKIKCLVIVDISSFLHSDAFDLIWFSKMFKKQQKKFFTLMNIVQLVSLQISFSKSTLKICSVLKQLCYLVCQSTK